jgi:uncharacterized protein YlaI
MVSILECSKRTVTKILSRLKLGCFNCGWDICRGDLHHIVPQAKQGTDAHSNLTYLCPNCHRMAHSGKLLVFKTVEEIVGETWKQFYNVTPRTKKPRNWSGKRFENTTEKLIHARTTRAILARAKAEVKLSLLEQSLIDKTRYGWIQQASTVLDVAPQSVVRYIRKYKPSYLDNAKIRQMTPRMNRSDET